jgi:precorrin-2 C20-methyltransferase/precorrin-3B C17-methyltransferase
LRPITTGVSGAEAGPAEQVRVVRLAGLDPADVDMRCLLIVGSSQTQWHRAPEGGGPDRVFTPRRYPG